MEKKDKNNGNGILIGGLVAVILVLAGLCVYLLFIKKDNEVVDNKNNNQENNEINNNNENKNDTSNNELIETNENKYTFEKKDNGDIVFFKDDEVVSEYKCGGVDCEIDYFSYETEFIEAGKLKTYILGDKVLIAVCDGESCDYIDKYGGVYFVSKNTQTAYGKVLLYDIVTGKYQTYNNVQSIMGNVGAVKSLKLDNGTIQLLSANRMVDRIIKEGDYDIRCYEGCRLNYDYEDNIIINKKNGKYGVEKLDSGEVLIDAKYDRLDYIDGGLLVAYSNKYFSFLNLNEEKIIDETIYVENPFDGPPKIDRGLRWFSKGDNTYTINIYDGTSYDNSKIYEYVYNVKTKELVKKN